MLSARSVERILAAEGFVMVRQKGSHRVWQRRGSGQSQTVIVPDHDEVRIGTLLSIIRQSGLDRDKFEVG